MIREGQIVWISVGNVAQLQEPNANTWNGAPHHRAHAQNLGHAYTRTRYGYGIDIREGRRGLSLYISS